MRPLASLVVLCGVVVAVPADAPADRVAPLIAKLGHPNCQVRETASKDLEAVGPTALPALSKATKSTDAEVARRATELSATIVRKASNERTLAPTPVELAFEDKPLAEVFAALEKQTGYSLAPGDANVLLGKVTVKTNGKVPFWVAIQQVCDAAGLELDAAHGKVAVSNTPEPLQNLGFWQPPPIKPLVMRPVLRQPLPVQPLIPARPAEDHAKRAEAARELADLLKRRMEVANRLQPAGGNDADKRKLEEQKQLLEAQRLLAMLAEDQARQLTAARSQPVSAAANPGSVTFRAKGAKANPACVSGAVRVEATPFPGAALPTVPGGLIPIVLTAAAEPKIKWESVESVRITKAIDDAGRSLVSAPTDSASLSTTVHPIQGGAVVFDGAGGLVLVPNGRSGVPGTPFQPQATQALVRLKAGDGPTKSLRELEGVIRAVVRAGPEEMVAVTGFDADAVTAFGPNGLGLKVSKLESVPDKDDEFALDVVVGYKAGEVQLADNSAPAATATLGGANEVIVRQQMVVGGEVVLRQRNIGPGGAGRRGGYRVAGENSGLSVFGLTVSDTDGKPFELTAPTSVRKFDPHGGVTDEVKLVLKATVKGQGKPAKVTFSGIRAKTVEVPFKLADVPVAMGAGPADDKPAKR